MTEDELRALDLSLPEATEQETWGEATFRVRGKIFVTIGSSGEGAGVKATLCDQAALVALYPEAFSVARYVGRYGWVSVNLRAVDNELLRDLVIEAWRRTAPKRLVAAVDAGQWDHQGTVESSNR